MSVKRYDPNYDAIAPADDLCVEADDGMFVMASDYDRDVQALEQEMKDSSDWDTKQLKVIHELNAKLAALKQPIADDLNMVSVPRELAERLAVKTTPTGWTELNTADAFAAACDMRDLLAGGDQ